MKDDQIATMLMRANENTMVLNQHRAITESYNAIKEAEDKLKKENKIKTFVVGGHHPLIRDTWLPQMSEQIGLNFVMVGHKLPARRAVGFMPDCTEFVFLMKDMASHALRNWAKKEAQKLNIPMLETTQKVLNAVEDFKNWSTRMYDLGQELKKQKAIAIQEALERGETVPEPVKDNGNYLYYDTFKSLVDNNIYSFFPFHSTEEKENRDFWFDKIRENLGSSYTYYIDELEEYMDKYLTEIRKKCPLSLKSKWVYSYFDDKNLDPENLKNSSRVNNAFKVIFNTRLPDELRKEVSDLLHLLHGSDAPPVVVEETQVQEILAVVEEPKVEETPAIVEQPQVEVVEEPKPIEQPKVVEQPKPIEQPKAVEQPKLVETKAIVENEERTISFTDLSLTLKKGSQILLKQVKANKLDLTQSQGLDVSIDKVEDGILYNVLIKY